MLRDQLSVAYAYACMLREASAVQNVILFLIFFGLKRVQSLLLFVMKPGVIFEWCVMWIPVSVVAKSP
jgi:hypothetical protein